ncbi:hypothetical protein [Chondromyces apiculatus]|uniref:WGR domain-containing protein n=1 Tax=Chondromyces apiculatus DSM 436 TaxID=1192034 RepID=A0A017SWE0_9BACT|nr:hypothetical protein [Chondromyces apiculatus]EYF01308.1 Hypothetical protein CAP_8462 [Chondromyces apiculatus DSM 436]
MTDGTKQDDLVTWHHFVLAAEDNGRAWRDRRESIAVWGKCVYLRERGSVITRASEEAAARLFEEKVAALRAKGYLGDGVEVGPVPAPRAKGATKAEEARAEKLLRMQEANAAFEAALPDFVASWKARGYDPCLSFLEQVRVLPRATGAVSAEATAGQAPAARLLPSDLAEACVSLAEGVFGVGFTRRTTSYDAEHGMVQRIPKRLMAEFYVSPAEVLAIARWALRGPRRTDDQDLPGVADELLARMRAM